MFELSISTTICKQQYIQKLFNLLSDEIKNDKGLIVKQNYHGRSYLALSVNEIKKDFYKAKVADFVCFVIFDDYKYNYLKEHLKVCEKIVLYQTFLKTIAKLDSDDDSEYIKEQLEFSGEILIDSFFYFKLQKLVLKWDNLVGIISQNNILLSSSSMVEIIKYMTLISRSKIVSVETMVGNKQLKIKYGLLKKTYKRTLDETANFLFDLIELNPKEINFCKQKNVALNDEVIEYLNKIFCDKIYLEN